MDLLILALLPSLQVSYGPPTLPMVFLAMLRFPFMLFRWQIALVFQVVGTLLVIYGFVIEPQFPKISRYKVSKPVSKPSGSITIVHLSDLHMEYLTQFERRVIDQVKALSPDLILFTGDFFNLSHRNDKKTNQDIVDFFNQIEGKSKIYAVTGSPAVDPNKNLEWILPQTNIRLLEDEAHSLEIRGVKVNIYGLSCSHNPNLDAHKLKTLLLNSPADGKANILLYHSPDLAPEISGSGIDLQLSGHTHGGQVQLPLCGPIFAASLYGVQLSHGHYSVNDRLNLIVSRGLGLEGNAAPRVRFLSSPEIGSISFEFLQDNVK